MASGSNPGLLALFLMAFVGLTVLNLMLNEALNGSERKAHMKNTLLMNAIISLATMVIAVGSSALGNAIPSIRVAEGKPLGHTILRL